MESPSAQGSMVPIWKVVGLTMAITLIGSLVWHYRAMAELRREIARDHNALVADVVILGQYRDLLQANGLESANRYLADQPTNYGF